MGENTHSPLVRAGIETFIFYENQDQILIIQALSSRFEFKIWVYSFSVKNRRQGLNRI